MDNEWSIPIDRIADEMYDGDIGKAVRGVAFQGLEGVVTITPVDTGRLRGGWLVSIGVPSGEVSTVEFAPPFSPKPSPAIGPATAHAMTRGSEMVAQIKPGDVVFIENNVEYGFKVNERVRMVERTAERLAGL